MTTTTATTSINQQHQNQQQQQEYHTNNTVIEEALTFETSILHLLLERNQKQHSRAPYYRRMAMTLRAIRRTHLIPSSSTTDVNSNNNDGGGGGLGALIATLEMERTRIASILQRYTDRQTMKRRRCDEWTIAGLSHRVDDTPIKHKNHNSNVDPNNQDNQLELSTSTNTNNNLPLLLQTIQTLHTTLTQHLPSLLSRILHATSALTTELSRGYFVPLCSVSLACLARIRVLVLRLGREGVMMLQTVIGWLKTTEFVQRSGGGGSSVVLEERTGLTVGDTRQVVRNCEDFGFGGEGGGSMMMMERFMEVDGARHGVFVERCAREGVVRRAYGSDSMSFSAFGKFCMGGSGGGRSSKGVSSSRIEDTHDEPNGGNDANTIVSNLLDNDDCEEEGKEKYVILSPSLDIGELDKEIEEEVGECVDITMDNRVDSTNTNTNYEEENLDKNLELVSLLKPQMMRQNATTTTTTTTTAAITSKNTKKSTDKKKKKQKRIQNSIIRSSSNDTNAIGTKEYGDDANSGVRSSSKNDILEDGVRSESKKRNKKSISGISSSKKRKKNKGSSKKQKKEDIFDDIFSGLC